MTATIIAAHKDANNAYLAVQVTENNGDNIEYHGTTPLIDPITNQPKTNVQIKIDLIASCKASRDTQMNIPSPLALIGTVTV